ncbi:hypothetical protein DPEC_G00202130 [Dallia pectoralis]|uniref:Uncharacterized protein n=1 Tax=Dallia pectoralis TaxID=75939 RepID=A0ACC2G9B0_DALPE|nr:hypothetical protein DPEC_G00202130 [Dallia pectoralis]
MLAVGIYMRDMRTSGHFYSDRPWSPDLQVTTQNNSGYMLRFWRSCSKTSFRQIIFSKQSFPRAAFGYRGHTGACYSLAKMEGFLQRCSAAEKGSLEGSSGVHVVLGNEACDLDSMVSSLAFAYFLSKTSGGSGRTVVPVLNIRRAQFPLRSDNVLLLKESGVPLEVLVFRDEVDLARLHKAKRLVLTLVDHNVLSSADSELEEAVVEVIDHHHLERTPSPSCSVTVETVGSCATLVTERIQRGAPEVIDRQVAHLLYGAILLDCVNMAPEAGKVTPKDRQMTRLLESRFSDLPPRGALFQSLQSAKFDVSGLSTEQILLKDMKAISGGDLTLAISSVYMTLDMFLQRRAILQELCEFCHTHRFGAVVAMTISFNELSEPDRQLAVYSSSALYREQVSHALEKARNPSLSLSPISSPHNDIRSYHQGNALATRKKVLPILKDFLKEWTQKQVHCGEAEDFEELDNFDPTRSPDVDDQPRCFSASRHHRRRLLGSEDSGMEDDFQVPATPMNSLVEGCPLDHGLPRISAEAILEKFSRLGEETEGKTDDRWPVVSLQFGDSFRKTLPSWPACALKTQLTRKLARTYNNMEQREEEQEEEDISIPRSSPSNGHDSEEISGISKLPNVRPAPPRKLSLGSRPRLKRLVAPALSLTLERSDSAVSDDYATAALSPSADDEDLVLDIDLDGMETPSDSESLHFPVQDPDVEDDLLYLGDKPCSGSVPEEMGVGGLDNDQVDGQGTRWRRFCTGDPPQESLVNMSVLEPYLRVLSHGGYYGDESNDIIVFSSCYLPENTSENYQVVMDNLFRYVVGTLDLMVEENYTIVYLCAITQRNKLPSIGWLKECYTTIDKRLRKNLQGLYVVHATWYIKALITIIKPFLSSKFSRKLQFIDSLQQLSAHIPTERVQIPDCVRQVEENMDR